MTIPFYGKINNNGTNMFGRFSGSSLGQQKLQVFQNPPEFQSGADTHNVYINGRGRFLCDCKSVITNHGLHGHGQGWTTLCASHHLGPPTSCAAQILQLLSEVLKHQRRALPKDVPDPRVSNPKNISLSYLVSLQHESNLATGSCPASRSQARSILSSIWHPLCLSSLFELQQNAKSSDQMTNEVRSAAVVLILAAFY